MKQSERVAELEARADAIFGGAEVTDGRSHLIGMYQGIVQALRPLTRDWRYGASVEDYGLRMIEQLLTQAEERLASDKTPGASAPGLPPRTSPESG